MPSLSDLVSALRPLAIPSTVVQPRPMHGADASVTSTKFGGRPYAESGDRWPMCGGCSKGLSFIFQFNFAECQHHRGRAGLFTFFYCRKCSSWGDIPQDLKDAWTVRAYPTPTSGRAIALSDESPPKLRVRPCSASLLVEPSLPDWEDLEQVAPTVAALLAQVDPDEPSETYLTAATAVLGAEYESRTQIGGYPHWIQGSAFYKCDTCRRPTRLLAQIDSENEPGLMWGDAGIVYLFECPDHPQRILMRLQCF